MQLQLLFDAFKDIFALAPIIVFLTELLAKYINLFIKKDLIKGFNSQLLSYFISLILINILKLFSQLFNLGEYLSEITFLNSLIYALMLSLVSNGIFDIPLAKKILKALKLKV